MCLISRPTVLKRSWGPAPTSLFIPITWIPDLVPPSRSQYKRPYQQHPRCSTETGRSSIPDTWY
eukprot:3719018-Rhodomonas_salina.1